MVTRWGRSGACPSYQQDERELLLSSQVTNETGVQRTQSFAGVRGVPENYLLLFAAVGGQSKSVERDIFHLEDTHKNYYQNPKRRRKK